MGRKAMNKSSTSRRRRTDGEQESLVDDRFSVLPDHIVQHILSFLDTKHAVLFSLVSKKYKNICTSYPNLDFDDRYFKEQDSFADFVTQFFKKKLDGGLKVGRFSFSCQRYTSIDPARIINEAVSRQVDHLIVMPDQLWYNLPSNLLTCKTLQTLSLKQVELPGWFRFTTITTLFLTSCSFFEGEFDVGLRCPNLTTLTLVGCNFVALKVSSGSKLVKLSIDSIVCEKVEISAMELSVLRIKQHFCTMDFTGFNLPSLKTAMVDLEAHTSDGDYDKLHKFLKWFGREASCVETFPTSSEIEAFIKNHQSVLGSIKDKKGRCWQYMLGTRKAAAQSRFGNFVGGVEAKTKSTGRRSAQ
ncbi:hypothetical protein Tsubulata_048359, partial [Turnera subulata]